MIKKNNNDVIEIRLIQNKLWNRKMEKKNL